MESQCFTGIAREHHLFVLRLFSDIITVFMSFWSRQRSVYDFFFSVVVAYHVLLDVLSLSFVSISHTVSAPVTIYAFVECSSSIKLQLSATCCFSTDGWCVLFFWDLYQRILCSRPRMSRMDIVPSNSNALVFVHYSYIRISLSCSLPCRLIRKMVNLKESGH